MRQQADQKMKKKAYVRRMKKIRILFWFVCACLLVSITATIVAKYYAKESRKGVATASGLYFTSNYLEKLSGEVLPERVNTNQWLGSGTCALNIEVNNYSNILLYNDENLNITYDMHFQMQEAPTANEAYKVVYKTSDGNGNETEHTLELNDTNKRTISGLYLPGGQAVTNYVQLQITPNVNDASAKVENSYRSKKVAVWVEPTAPDYVANSNRLGAILSATPSKHAFTFQGAFDVSEKMEGLSLEECKALLESHAGFPYKVQTSGELDSSYEGKEMRITWNSTYLELDMYNKYYQEAKEKDLVTTVTNTSTGVAYTSIVMDITSYTSMEFDFYKTASFGSFTMTSLSDFTNLVMVDIVEGAGD